MGKRLLKIRVVSDISHINCTLMQSGVRNIFRMIPIIDILPVFFGSRKRLGDMFASTIVINAEQ